MDGQFSNPVRVVAFNTAKGWSRDASEEIADELRQRLSADDREIPPDLEDFIERHGRGRPVQLPLPLRGAAWPYYRIRIQGEHCLSSAHEV